MWHVSSCSGVATLRTAIHLSLTYLLQGSLKQQHTRRLETAGYTVRRWGSAGAGIGGRCGMWGANVRVIVMAHTISRSLFSILKCKVAVHAMFQLLLRRSPVCSINACIICSRLSATPLSLVDCATQQHWNI